jgi:hypothetical protein
VPLMEYPSPANDDTKDLDLEGILIELVRLRAEVAPMREMIKQIPHLEREIVTLRASRRLMADRVDQAQRNQDAMEEDEVIATDEAVDAADDTAVTDVPLPWAPMELRVFSGPECPSGWDEYAPTKGFALVGRPASVVVPTFVNSAMKVGEESRTCSGSLQTATEGQASVQRIALESDPSAPGIDVTINSANSSGYPLAYLMICCYGCGNPAETTGAPSSPSTGSPTIEPTYLPTQHPCSDGSHSCDLTSTYCASTDADDIAEVSHTCVCLEGFVTDPSSDTQCLPTESPTATPTEEPTEEFGPTEATPAPTFEPTYEPTFEPTTLDLTKVPTSKVSRLVTRHLTTKLHRDAASPQPLSHSAYSRYKQMAN